MTEAREDSTEAWDELDRMVRDQSLLLAVGDHPGWPLLAKLGPLLPELLAAARRCETAERERDDACRMYLESHVGRALARISVLETNVAAAEIENQRLRAALRPFAKAGELFVRLGHGDPDQVVCSSDAGQEYWLTGRHLIAANSALGDPR